MAIVDSDGNYLDGATRSQPSLERQGQQQRRMVRDWESRGRATGETLRRLARPYPTNLCNEIFRVGDVASYR
jgi:hypothetical protein